MAKKKITELTEEMLESEVQEAAESGVGSVSKLPGNIGQGRILRTDYQDLPLGQLIAYQGNMGEEDFSPMPEAQFQEMVNSIRENGVLEAISVRMVDFGKYEILAGHHRYAAAKEAGLSVIPAKVYKNLTDEQAEDIYNLTNLMRRELTFSDKCNGWYRYWSRHKDQGGRFDLRQELKEAKDLVEITGISERQIRRYVKMHSLTAAMKKEADQKRLSARVAYPLSFLTHEQQDLVFPYLPSITELKAEALKQMSMNGDWDDAEAVAFLQEARQVRPLTAAVREIRRYAKDTLSPGALERVDEIFVEALELYLQKHPEDKNGWGGI